MALSSNRINCGRHRRSCCTQAWAARSYGGLVLSQREDDCLPNPGGVRLLTQCEQTPPTSAPLRSDVCRGRDGRGARIRHLSRGVIR